MDWSTVIQLKAVSVQKAWKNNKVAKTSINQHNGRLQTTTKKRQCFKVVYTEKKE